MKKVAWILAVMLGAGIAHATDRVEIVVDVSASMWSVLQDGTPRVVAVREALEDLAMTLGATRGGPEVGLRAVGGTSDLWHGASCGDTEVLVPVGPVQYPDWRLAVADLEPKGARGLVGAVTAAVNDLGSADDVRRVVVITSGEDECGGAVGEIRDVLGEGESAVEARFIGLALRGATGADLAVLAPTRIVTDRKGLVEALRWAVLPTTARPPGDRRFELHLLNSEDGHWDEIRVENQATGQVEAISLVNGIARNRVAPGLYRATVETSSIRNLALADLAVGAEGGFFEISFPPAPVTLEPNPDRPVAGSMVFIHYWGAPEGRTWIALAPKDAPLGDYLLRQPAIAGEGDVAFRLPGEMIEFEARCVIEDPAGVLLFCGSAAFAARLEIASLQAPERAEIKTPLTIEWSGPDLPDDRIMIGRAEGDDDGWAACLFTSAGSPLRLVAPVVPGKYRIRYVSSGERVLARSDLEVYEILAVLAGPETVEPGEEFTVDWEGPDGNHDFVAISTIDAPSEEYLDFSPTAVGTSVSLRAPNQEGHYELRYVRSADGEVLAREEIAVVATAISLQAPKEVDAGNRFTVTWSGASSEGDFIALAPAGSNPRRHLDFAFTSQGHTVSLAAPFRPGKFEVRYISASGGQVLARVPLRVR